MRTLAVWPLRIASITRVSAASFVLKSHRVVAPKAASASIDHSRWHTQTFAPASSRHAGRPSRASAQERSSQQSHPDSITPLFFDPSEGRPLSRCVSTKPPVQIAFNAACCAGRDIRETGSEAWASVERRCPPGTLHELCRVEGPPQGTRLCSTLPVGRIRRLDQRIDGFRPEVCQKPAPALLRIMISLNPPQALARACGGFREIMVRKSTLAAKTWVAEAQHVLTCSLLDLGRGLLSSIPSVWGCWPRQSL